MGQKANAGPAARPGSFSTPESSGWRSIRSTLEVNMLCTPTAMQECRSAGVQQCSGAAGRPAVDR